MKPECLSLVGEPEPEPLPSRDLSSAAGWMIVVLIVAVAVFELWALARGKHTISQRIQHLARGRTWVKVLGVIGMGVLTYHLLWGFFW